MAFGEDHSQKRHKNAAANFALVRRIALNILRQDNTPRIGVHNKRLMAGWDEDYLKKILKI